MRTCPKVRGIAAHCVRLCQRNDETTAGLTELTINCNNNVFWYVYTSPRLFLLESQSKQQHDFVTGKVKVYKLKQHSKAQRQTKNSVCRPCEHGFVWTNVYGQSSIL